MIIAIHILIIRTTFGDENILFLLLVVVLRMVMISTEVAFEIKPILGGRLKSIQESEENAQTVVTRRP
jgi:hypothetical protein